MKYRIAKNTLEFKLTLSFSFSAILSLKMITAKLFLSKLIGFFKENKQVLNIRLERLSYA